jgi:hypothetical protein
MRYMRWGGNGIMGVAEHGLASRDQLDSMPCVRILAPVRSAYRATAEKGSNPSRMRDRFLAFLTIWTFWTILTILTNLTNFRGFGEKSKKYLTNSK